MTSTPCYAFLMVGADTPIGRVRLTCARTDPHSEAQHRATLNGVTATWKGSGACVRILTEGRIAS